MEKTYFRSGLGLKAEVRPLIDAEYQSAVIERIRSKGYVETFGDVTVRLAQEFGFCYGVDRAVDYAYETRRKFPDKRIFLVGEIIHNPHVNAKMENMGIQIIGPLGGDAWLLDVADTLERLFAGIDGLGRPVPDLASLGAG